MFDPDQPATPTLTLLEALRQSEWRAGRASLASRFSHDLGTPLNVILGRVNLILASDDLPEATGRHARLIAEAAKSIADGLQTVVDEERLTAVPSPVDVGELLDRVMALLERHAAMAEVELTYAPSLEDGELMSNTDVPATVNIITSLAAPLLTADNSPLEVTSCLETVERPDDLRCAPGRFVRIAIHSSAPGGFGEQGGDPRRAHTHKHLLRALGGFLRSEPDGGKSAINIFLPMRRP